MMKTYNKYFLYAVTLLSISVSGILCSCEDNINLSAEGIITADGYYTSLDDFDKALNASYVRLNQGNYDLWIDGSSDNGLTTHSWNRGYDISRGIGNSFSSFPSDKWTQGYISVQKANGIVNNIDLYAWPGGASDPTRNQVLGEAKALRSYFYLDLVCLFGNILFYETNPASVPESETVPQVEPKVVFDFILKDLEEAIAGLPDQPANKSKFGKPAARLLRARAAAYAAGYLNDKSYLNITLSETQELLKSAPVLGDFASLFVTGNENVPEVMLVKRYTQESTNGWSDWYNNSITGYCVTTPVKALVDAYEYIGEVNPNLPYVNKEPRFYATIYAPGTLLRDKYYNTIPDNTVVRDGKYYFDPSKDYGEFQDREIFVGDVLGEEGGGEWNKTPTGFSYKKYFAEPDARPTWNSFIVFRFAEVYLLRAEALVETGGSESEAKELIKALRDRAGNTNDMDAAITNIYGGSLLNLIRNERRVELAQEGLRLFDIRRWKILPDVMNKPVYGIEYRDFSGGTPVRKYLIPAGLADDGSRVPYTEKDYWWPVPQAEIDLNKGRIKQNSSW
ncbi:MAG: RagB/SusD family nutrient uptake outer membrane protein [Tannerella sp.]|jgi:hypothetical protein|nr:RagB/SusD family nutrient uptake outer membrane protein [Tannerella sp.]